jgi:hypothetical protein
MLHAAVAWTSLAFHGQPVGGRVCRVLTSVWPWLQARVEELEAAGQAAGATAATAAQQLQQLQAALAAANARVEEAKVLLVRPCVWGLLFCSCMSRCSLGIFVAAAVRPLLRVSWAACQQQSVLIPDLGAEGKAVLHTAAAWSSSSAALVWCSCLHV